MHHQAWLSAIVFLALGCGGGDAVHPVAPAAHSAPASPALHAAATPAPPKAPVALEEYFKIRRVGGRVSFSFDEKLVAFLSDEGGRPDIWVRPLAGGAATQISHSDGFVHSLAFSPTQDVLAFEADHGGDELPHLYLTDSTGKAPRDIVPDLPPGRRTGFVEWADDGKSFVFLSSARDEKAMDLYEYDVAKGKASLLFEAEGKVELMVVSRDHKRFVVREQHSASDNDLDLVERSAPGKRVKLTAHEGDARFTPQYFSKDGRTLYVTSDAGGEFTSLSAIDVATRKTTPVLQGDWDIEFAAPSSTFRYALTSANADGSPQLVVTESKGGAKVALPAPPGGGAWDPSDETTDGPGVLGFSRTDRYLAVMLRTDTAPDAPYALDLKEGRAIALADPRPASLRDHTMIAGTSVRIPSFDGKLVPAFLYVPAGPGPFPAVIDVHGGPNWQAHRVFSRMRQYLLSKGYAVLAPNVRGSTGYGKAWTRLDDMDLGGGPLKDVVACKKYLVDHARVAKGKVVVMGQSYGGYMALAAATFTPDEFAANVDYFGVSDMKRLVEGLPPYWTQMSLIYQKWGDPKNPADAAYQHDRSPIHFADKVTRPLLVVQGESDARVKMDQSERIVAALRQRHVPVHYLLLKGEGHGFTKNESYLAAYHMTDRFLDRYVLGDTTAAVE